jgi:hypothetical protein
MGRAGDSDIRLPTVQVWWRSFHRASQHRWVTTLVLTALACGLLFLCGRAWLFLVVGGDETTGYVVRERDAVRYDVGGQRYTVREGWTLPGGTRIWGDPVRVQYLRIAPGVSWCPDSEDHSLLAALLVVYVVFVVAPLIWLWGKTIVQPARQALRKVRAALAGKKPAGGTGQQPLFLHRGAV